MKESGQKSTDSTEFRREFLRDLARPVGNAIELWRAFQTEQLYKPPAGERIITQDRKELEGISAITRRKVLALGVQGTIVVGVTALVGTAIKMAPHIQIGPRELKSFENLGLQAFPDSPPVSPESPIKRPPVFAINQRLQEEYEALKRRLPQEQTTEAVTKFVSMHGYVPFWETALAFLQLVDLENDELRSIVAFYRQHGKPQGEKPGFLGKQDFALKLRSNVNPFYEHSRNVLAIPVTRAMPNFWSTLFMAIMVRCAQIRNTAKLPPNATSRDIYGIAYMNSFQIAKAACGQGLWDAYAEEISALTNRMEREKWDKNTTIEELKKMLARIHDKKFGLEIASMPKVDQLLILTQMGRWATMYNFDPDLPEDQQKKLQAIMDELQINLFAEAVALWKESCPCKLLKKTGQQSSEDL